MQEHVASIISMLLENVSIHLYAYMGPITTLISDRILLWGYKFREIVYNDLKMQEQVTSLHISYNIHFRYTHFIMYAFLTHSISIRDLRSS